MATDVSPDVRTRMVDDSLRDVRQARKALDEVMVEVVELDRKCRMFDAGILTFDAGILTNESLKLHDELAGKLEEATKLAQAFMADLDEARACATDDYPLRDANLDDSDQPIEPSSERRAENVHCPLWK